MMLENEIVELYRKTSTQLPSDVERALRSSSISGSEVMKIMAENAKIARKESIPMCQDTGTPHFFVKCPAGRQGEIKKAIEKATKRATAEVPLRKNAIDTLTGTVIENKAVVHFEDSGKTEITLLLNGGGCENIGVAYSLPCEPLGAERNLDGVRKCVLDAVFRAQGRGCPPYVVGIGIGSTRDVVALLSKKQLLRRIDDVNPEASLAKLEGRLVNEINSLNIGPAGMGGVPTALAVKIGTTWRHPASYFVDVSFSCWADRRATRRL